MSFQGFRCTWSEINDFIVLVILKPRKTFAVFLFHLKKNRPDLIFESSLARFYDINLISLQANITLSVTERPCDHDSCKNC